MIREEKWHLCDARTSISIHRDLTIVTTCNNWHYTFSLSIFPHPFSQDRDACSDAEDNVHVISYAKDYKVKSLRVEYLAISLYRFIRWKRIPPQFAYARHIILIFVNNKNPKIIISFPSQLSIFARFTYHIVKYAIDQILFAMNLIWD